MRAASSWALHAGLFFLTFLSTTAFGSALVSAFRYRLPLSSNAVYAGYARLLHLHWPAWDGLWFSAPLLTILLAHEFGHYLACQYWGVDATLPYFLPSPTLLGSFGAFIRIRSPIYTRAILFDIGFSGPVAGFLVLIPFLLIGVWQSHVVPGIALRGEFGFSTPLLIAAAEHLRFHSLPSMHIQLHPMAMAAWGGLLATAINLLPLGQLDGGHILYSVVGERWHHVVATVFVGVLVVFGFLYWPWWLWAVLMFFFGRRHPLVYDNAPLAPGRRVLAVTALLMLILSISIIPVTTR